MSKNDDDNNLTTAVTFIPHNNRESEEDDCEVQEFSIKTTMISSSSSFKSEMGELKEQSPMPDENEIEEKEEEIKTTSKSKLDWEALIAAAEEDFDLLDSPMDAAVKTLMTGKEIQKLSVIRTMPDTITTYGEEAINRLLPLIQDMVSSEVSLDVHCDSSDLFKTLIKDKTYESKFPGLTDKLLSYILENIDRVKDNVAAAAWLETLFDIVECIQPQTVTELVSLYLKFYCSKYIISTYKAFMCKK
uniref:Uncharacterized protein n=1 Tax=Panagrolaimus sp. PS1159 TaxID=55785 RepID=A0AC35GDS7_9BILA